MTFAKKQLESKISNLKETIVELVKSKDIWYDSGFKSPIDHFGGKDSNNLDYVLVLYSEYGFPDIFRTSNLELAIEFEELISNTEFGFETDYNAWAYFFAVGSELKEAFASYFTVER